MNKKVLCPLCGETMAQQDLGGDVFWECGSCRAEVWPYDEKVEKVIREAMRSAPVRKRGRGERRRKKYKTVKAGMKYVPWYQR